MNIIPHIRCISHSYKKLNIQGLQVDCHASPCTKSHLILETKCHLIPKSILFWGVSRQLQAKLSNITVNHEAARKKNCPDICWPLFAAGQFSLPSPSTWASSPRLVLFIMFIIYRDPVIISIRYGSSYLLYRWNHAIYGVNPEGKCHIFIYMTSPRCLKQLITLFCYTRLGYCCLSHCVGLVGVVWGWKELLVRSLLYSWYLGKLLDAAYIRTSIYPGNI